ncbi:MAG: hypothetical protein ACRCT1_13420 [Microcoleaceae cyanobacterium]
MTTIYDTRSRVSLLTCSHYNLFGTIWQVNLGCHRTNFFSDSYFSLTIMGKERDAIVLKPDDNYQYFWVIFLKVLPKDRVSDKLMKLLLRDRD